MTVRSSRGYESPGQPIVVERDGKSISTLLSADLLGANGIVHNLDALLLQ